MTQQTQFLMTKGSDIINVTDDDLATYLADGWTAVNVRYSEGGEESDLISQVLMIKGTDAIRVRPDSVLTYEAQGYAVRNISYGTNALSISSVTVDESAALPYVVSARLLLDLQADTLDLEDDDPVSTWADQSGNGNDFTQTGSARPVKQTIGGIPFVVPDGVNDWMDGGNFADNLDNFAVFVIRQTLVSTGGVILSKMDVNTDWEYSGWWINGGSKAGIFLAQGETAYVFREGATDLDTEVTYLSVCEKFSDNSMHVYINGVLDDGDLTSSGTVPSVANSQNVKLWIEGGDNGVDDQGYGKVSIAAVMIYEITDVDNWPTDRAAIEAWLADRYGVTL